MKTILYFLPIIVAVIFFAGVVNLLIERGLSLPMFIYLVLASLFLSWSIEVYVKHRVKKVTELIQIEINALRQNLKDFDNGKV